MGRTGYEKQIPACNDIIFGTQMKCNVKLNEILTDITLGLANPPLTAAEWGMQEENYKKIKGIIIGHS